MKMRYLSHDYASKSYSTIIEQNFFNCINRTNTVYTRVRVTHCMIFGKPYLHIPVNLIYSTIHIIPTTMPYHIQYNYIDITILLSYCNYYNQYNITVTISIQSIDKNI
mgnify:CR=1 FL=1